MKEQGRIDEAVRAYESALEFNPNQPESHHNLAIALKRQGQLDQAIAHYRRAVELKPAYVDAHDNLGIALRERGDLDEVLACYERALQLKPGKPESCLGMGLVLKNMGRLEEAVAHYQQALAVKPDYSEAHSNLGNALQSLGRLDDAIDSYHRALHFKPDGFEAHNNLGVALQKLGRLDEALDSYRRALEVEPGYAEAHLNSGNVLEMLGHLDQAVAAYQRALDARPAYAPALSQQVYQQLKMCDWQDWEERVNRVIHSATEQGERVPPFLILALPATPEQQLESARHWSKPFEQPASRFHHSGDDDSRLTIGYLSADFRDHPVAQLAVELFERHDRDRVEVLGFSFGPDDGSAVRGRVTAAFDRFVDMRALSFEQAAGQVHAAGVDILVDLMGYTTHARTQIAALRPAPLQVNFLGYPGTMGCNFIDYIIVDDFVVSADR